MRKNIGKIDRFIRLFFALLFVVLAFFHSPYWWILAIILAITSFINFCGLYQILGISTVKKEKCEVIRSESNKVQPELEKKINNHANDEIELDNGLDEENSEDHNSEEIEI